MKSVFEYLGFRRLAVNYLSPAICEAEFSSTSEPTIVLEPFTPVRGPTGGAWGQDGDNLNFTWDTVPGALCYSVYRAVDALDPYGEYILVAECTEDTNYTITITDPNVDCVPYRISAITPDGETELSDPITPICEDVFIPYDTSVLLYLTAGSNPSVYGDMLTFTAHVIDGDPANPPTGFVDFYDDDAFVSSQPLDMLQQASFSISTLPMGVHNIRARYLGDLTNNPSNSLPLAQTVNVNPGDACEQVGPPVPETFREDIPDEEIMRLEIHFKFNQDFPMTVPAGKRGIYQLRYLYGSHAYRCPDREDRPGYDYTPDYQVWAPMYGSVWLWEAELGNWVTPAWAHHIQPIPYPGGYRICANIDPDGWGLNLDLGEGFCGWGNSGSQEALVTEPLLNGPEPGQESFCWETPTQLAAGSTYTLHYAGPDMLPSCITGLSDVEDETLISDILCLGFIRVAKLIDQPEVATVLEHPHLGNIEFREFSYTENLCDYSSIPEETFGFCLLRGNTYARKWQLYIPLEGGWVGEKLYGTTMIGNYQRISDPSTGPDCLVVV